MLVLIVDLALVVESFEMAKKNAEM